MFSEMLSGLKEGLKNPSFEVGFDVLTCLTIIAAIIAYFYKKSKDKKAESINAKRAVIKNTIDKLYDIIVDMRNYRREGTFELNVSSPEGNNESALKKYTLEGIFHYVSTTHKCLFLQFVEDIDIMNQELGGKVQIDCLGKYKSSVESSFLVFKFCLRKVQFKQSESINRALFVKLVFEECKHIREIIRVYERAGQQIPEEITQRLHDIEQKCKDVADIHETLFSGRKTPYNESEIIEQLNKVPWADEYFRKFSLDEMAERWQESFEAYTESVVRYYTQLNKAYYDLEA